MGRYASEGGNGFKAAPAGTHVARCYRIIDLGTQHGEYQGQPNVRNQIMVQWELPSELMDDGKPYSVSKFYTNSLSEKATLRADLESWRSRGFTAEELMKFDLMNIIGKPCMVTVVHAESGKAKVTSVSAMPKGMQCPSQVNESDAFWIDEWDDNKFHALPKKIQDIIVQSDEYKAFSGRQKADPVDDDIPF